MTVYDALPTWRQILISLLLGICFGLLLMFADDFASWPRLFIEKNFSQLFEKERKPGPEVKRPVKKRVFSSRLVATLPATFGYRGESLKEESERKLLAWRAAQKRIATQSVAIPKNPKNPNAIRISLSQAPSLLSAKMVNGRAVCGHKKDKPRMSRKYDEVHVDRQCCLDPDEIPNPRCDYGYKL